MILSGFARWCSRSACHSGGGGGGSLSVAFWTGRNTGGEVGVDGPGAREGDSFVGWLIIKKAFNFFQVGTVAPPDTSGSGGKWTEVGEERS